MSELVDLEALERIIQGYERHRQEGMGRVANLEVLKQCLAELKRLRARIAAADRLAEAAEHARAVLERNEDGYPKTVAELSEALAAYCAAGDAGVGEK